MPAVKTHTPELRRRLIDTAARLVAESGIGALSLRRLAQAESTSTMAVYTLFGDKAGLLEQMLIEGFNRLHAELRTASHGDDPVSDLFALGLAYRNFALKNGHLYDLMFGRSHSEYAPGPEAIAAARATDEPLIDGIERCIEAGAFRKDLSAPDVAYHLWGVSHGLVSLELNGCVSGRRTELESRYREALGYTGVAYLAQP